MLLQICIDLSEDLIKSYINHFLLHLLSVPLHQAQFGHLCGPIDMAHFCFLSCGTVIFLDHAGYMLDVVNVKHPIILIIIWVLQLNLSRHIFLARVG